MFESSLDICDVPKKEQLAILEKNLLDEILCI